MDKTKTMARHDRKRAQLGQYAKCADCQIDGILELRRVKVNGLGDQATEVVLCAKCHLTRQGKGATERHHPAGRANDPFTVAIAANDHAVLSDMQQDWPPQTLRNREGSPLLAMAAAVRGWLDVLRLIIERSVGWIPDRLEQLDGILRVQVSPAWWTMPGFELRGKS